MFLALLFTLSIKIFGFIFALTAAKTKESVRRMFCKEKRFLANKALCVNVAPTIVFVLCPHEQRCL